MLLVFFVSLVFKAVPMKTTFIALGFVLLLSSCKNTTRYEAKEQKTDRETVSAQAELPGKKLMETHCYVCHAPQGTVSRENRIAPPMAMVQNHYIDSHTTKAAFRDAFLAFIENPSEATAKMPGAIQHFGLMPYQKFPDGVPEQIADYLYENYPLEDNQRGYKGKGMRRSRAQNDTVKTVLEQKAETGLAYALETQQLLGQNLMRALQKEGSLYALEFCNVEAIPLTRQMEEKHGAVIKRVSDKNRNPENAANAEELYYIAYFKTEIASGKDPKPVVLPAGDQTRFYYPIVTNSMCLQCHGTPDKIAPETLSRIKVLYPEDAATGYTENEVRGIWSIVF